MNYEIVGKLIFKEETQHISDRFQKWENKGQVSYFTNLEGWRIEKVAPQNPANIPVPEYRVEDIPPMPEADDLPF